MAELIATFAFLLAVLAAGVVGGWKTGFLTTGLSIVGVLYLFYSPVLHAHARQSDRRAAASGLRGGGHGDQPALRGSATGLGAG